MFTIEELKSKVTSAGHKWFTDQPNIVGIRTKFLDTNTFNDDFYIEYKGELVHAICTTEPGLYYLKNPCNPKGTGMLPPGQYINCWKLGLHNCKYIAFVQVGKMKAYRDNDKDSTFEIDPATIEDGLFGCNGHHAFNTEVQGDGFKVDNWSAMCQVILHITDYIDIMRLAFEYDGFTGKLFSYTLLQEK